MEKKVEGSQFNVWVPSSNPLIKPRLLPRCSIILQTESGEEIYLGNSHSGIIIRRLDGHIKQEFKRSQITELTVNKKALCIHTHKKKLSAKFLLVRAVINCEED